MTASCYEVPGATETSLALTALALVRDRLKCAATEPKRPLGIRFFRAPTCRAGEKRAALAPSRRCVDLCVVIRERDGGVFLEVAIEKADAQDGLLFVPLRVA